MAESLRDGGGARAKIVATREYAGKKDHWRLKTSDPFHADLHLCRQYWPLGGNSLPSWQCLSVDSSEGARHFLQFIYLITSTSRIRCIITGSASGSSWRTMKAKESYGRHTLFNYIIALSTHYLSFRIKRFIHLFIRSDIRFCRLRSSLSSLFPLTLTLSQLLEQLLTK